MKITFIDAGVLVTAARGVGEISEKALNVLTDSEREFASSVFIKLEVLPKAMYNRQTEEAVFMKHFLVQSLIGLGILNRLYKMLITLRVSMV